MKTGVAICTYNGERYIAEQLKSIITQSVAVDQIVLCDDCSSDNTVAVAEAILKNSDVPYKIVVNDETLRVTKNFEKAAGLLSDVDVIFFCDQDDVWATNKVERHLAAYTSPSVLLVFSDAVLFSDTGVEKDTIFDRFGFARRRKAFLQNQFKAILQGWFVTGATMSVRADFATIAMPYPEVMLHDQWLSALAASKGGLFCLDEAVTMYRQHSAQVVGSKKISSIDALKISVDTKKELRIINALFAAVSPDLRSICLDKSSWLFRRDMLRKRMLIGRITLGFVSLCTGFYCKYGANGVKSYLKDVLRGDSQ